MTHGGTAGAMFDFSAALGASCRRFVSLRPCPLDMILRDVIPLSLVWYVGALNYSMSLIFMFNFSRDILFLTLLGNILRYTRDI